MKLYVCLRTYEFPWEMELGSEGQGHRWCFFCIVMNTNRIDIFRISNVLVMMNLYIC